MSQVQIFPRPLIIMFFPSLEEIIEKESDIVIFRKAGRKWNKSIEVIDKDFVRYFDSVYKCEEPIIPYYVNDYLRKK